MSSPVFVQRGSSFRDSFLYMNSDGTFNTGRVQADFTVKCSFNGANRGTTGITITEVNSSTNPGEYAVVLDGATGPAATVGSYTLVITRTSDPGKTWEQTYIVASNVTSTVTGVPFTATASNGRAMTGATPLASASVLITLSGAAVATTTTDANGLWGPVYFTADGTYTVVIQKSGYANASGTITVSGGATAVAGPGADLTLSATAVNPLTASELWAYFTRMARDVSGTKADAERKQGVQDALDMVAKERQWRWLLRRGWISLNAAVIGNSATFTSGSTTVTFGSSIVPSWAASGKIRAVNRIYDVKTRTSGTQVELEAAYTGTSGTYTADFFQDEYPLESNLLWFHELIPGPWWGWGGSPSGPEDFYRHQSAWLYGQQFPNVWCLHNGNIVVAPYPTQANTVPYTYYARPAVLTSGADIADWDPAQIEVLRRAIDVQVAYRYGTFAGGDSSQAMARYKEALSRAVATDRGPTISTNALNDVSAYDLPRTAWQRRTVQ